MDFVCISQLCTSTSFKEKAYKPSYVCPPKYLIPEERKSDPNYNTIAVTLLPRICYFERSEFDEKLGFTFAGGAEYGNYIYITHVTPDSKADNAGLKEGDCIQKVNRDDFSNVTHVEAMLMLKEFKTLKITVKHYPYGYKKLFSAPPRSRSSTLPRRCTKTIHSLHSQSHHQLFISHHAS